MTIKASLDGGLTWNGGIMLDEEGSWGYSILSVAVWLHGSERSVHKTGYFFHIRDFSVMIM